jgi:serine/threonine-protein kinase
MTTLVEGDLVGRYRILRTLGSGAMGVVYLAEDPQIERLLAIKTVRALSDEPREAAERRERLLREARTVGRLIHPHIVTLFDAGDHEGTLYLALEYVEGESLDRRLRDGQPATTAEALRIAREAAAGLAFAHRRGVVHRDVKPANLLLAADGRVKVSDFGIAKVVGQATELTLTGTVIGSPHYLSPEQVRGEELDGRSDLFSLGVVLYELLGGRRPFEAETLTTLVYQILHQPPPPMALRPGLAPRLTEALSRLLAKDRGERFATADEAVEALAALERDLPPEVLAAPAVAAEPGETTHLLAMTGALSAPEAPLPAAPGGTASRRGLWLGAVAAAGVALLVAAGVAAVLVSGRLEEGGRPLSAAQEASPTPGGATADDGERPAVRPEPESPVKPVASALPARDRAGAAGEDREASAPVRPPEPRPAATPAAAPAAGSDEVAPPRSAPQLVREALEERPGLRRALKERVEQTLEGVDQRLDSGLSLRLDVQPADSFVLLDGRVIGRARDYGSGPAGGRFELPEPGLYLLKLRSPGMADHRILLRARADGASPTVVSARLLPAPSAELELGDLPLVRVQEAVGFAVHPPTAQVEVDGRPAGRADRYPGRFARPATWLRLPPGRHRVSLVAPGFERRDYAVEVSAGAAEARRRIEVRLTPVGGAS